MTDWTIRARRAALTGATALGLLAGPVGAATEPAILPVDEIRAGQTGWGESVFAGSARERFEVEVLGVLRDLAPGTDYVMARLSGRGLEQTGVIAGMSGSPVWIDGKLIGAVAFSWPFATEAIAGITPIQAMRDIEVATPRARAPGRPAVSLSELAAGELPADLLARAAGSLARAAGLEARGAVVWGAAGFSERALDRLGTALPALSPVASGRVDGVEGEIEAGSSVAAVFVDGDLRLAATGTVTERSGDRVLAFGHPIAGVGEVSLPLAPAEVVTVLPSRFSSFKIANAGPIRGEFVRDHAAGTLGRLGVAPRTVPFDIRVEGGSSRAFHLRLARVPQFLPLLAAIGTLGAVDAAASAGGTQGVDLELGVDLGARGRLDLAQSFDGAQAATGAVQFLFAVLDFLLQNDLAAVELESLSATVVPWAEPRGTRIVGAHAARSRVEPGESLDLFVDLRGWRDRLERRVVTVAIPPDLPSGRYDLLVADGASAGAATRALEPVEPVDFEQALELLRGLGSSRELAVLGVLPGPGLAVAGEALPRLPASVRQIWSAGGGARPLRLAVAQRDRFPVDRPLAGLVRVQVEVRRPQPAREPAAGEPGGSTESPAPPDTRPSAGVASPDAAAPPPGADAGDRDER